MRSFHFSYHQTQKLSSLVNDYLANADYLNDFYNRYPYIENFSKQYKEKSNHKIDRETLVQVLKSQNQELDLSCLSIDNINSLREENTFSVTTGHQLCLFTGPLYFLYKIVSTIKLAEELKQKYPEKKFVPVFWMASEDHDFQEVNHVHLFGKTLKWETNQRGSVGRMSLDGMEDVLDELDISLGSGENAKYLSSLFRDAYLKHTNLADATRFLVNSLFSKYGLVIIDGDDIRLKKQFISVIKRDVLHQGTFETISNCSQALGKKYKVQAFVRDINFFKLDRRSRTLIKEKVDESEIEDNPEKFSPNVLIRPIYQEFILPNLAYVGGGSELAYWMQLKTIFKKEQIPFPILVLRNSVLWLEQKQVDKWRGLGFDLDDLFLEEYQLHQKYIVRKTELNFTRELNDLKSVFSQVLSKTSDKGLKKSVLAEQVKQLRSFEKLEKKILNFEKIKHENSLNQITHLKQRLFPKKGLQERYDNFIPFYLKHGENFIEILQKELSPLDAKFVILIP